MGNPIANAQGDNLLYGGEVDPRVNAINMPANAVYIYAPPSGTGALLRKQDNGPTTNFDTLVTDAMARDFSNAQPAANALDLNSQLINNLLDPVAAQDAATKNYVDLGDALNLPLVGGTMTGGINMGANIVSNMGTPSSAGDATTKNYVDTADSLKLDLAGGTMSGVLNMGANVVSNAADPTNPQDVATKNYVDSLPPGGDAWGDPVDANIVPNNNSRRIGSSATPFDIIYGESFQMGRAGTDGNIGFYDGSGTFAGLLQLSSFATPSGFSGAQLQMRTDDNRALSMFTFNNANPDAAPTANVYLESGNKTAGTGDSGSINIITGTSAGGTRGDVTMSGNTLDVSGFSSYVGFPGGGDAWSDPVDATIAPAGANDGAFNLGASGQEFGQGYIRQLYNTGDASLVFDFNTNGQVTLARNFYPDTAGIRSLGFDTGGREWNKVAARDFVALDPTGTNNPKVMFRAQDSSFDGARIDIYKTMPSGYIPAGYVGELGNSKEGFGVGTEPVFSTDTSGPLHLETGNCVDGASGDIIIAVGTPSGTGSRGTIRLDALMMQLPTGTADPGSASVAGEAYFKTGTNELRVYDGTGWVGVTLA